MNGQMKSVKVAFHRSAAAGKESNGLTNDISSNGIFSAKEASYSSLQIPIRCHTDQKLVVDFFINFKLRMLL